jgi:hypothetical protein
VPFIEQDTLMYPHIETIRQLVAQRRLQDAVMEAVG